MIVSPAAKERSGRRLARVVPEGVVQDSEEGGLPVRAGPVQDEDRLLRGISCQGVADGALEERKGRWVATADLFPRVTILGRVGYASLGIETLAQPAAQLWSIGPSIRIPICS